MHHGDYERAGAPNGPTQSPAKAQADDVPRSSLAPRTLLKSSGIRSWRAQDGRRMPDDKEGGGEEGRRGAQEAVGGRRGLVASGFKL